MDRMPERRKEELSLLEWFREQVCECLAILRALMREGRSEIETMPVAANTPSLLALSLVGNKLILHVTHLGMSSGFLPEPKLGPRFLLSLGLTIAQRLAY